MSDINIFDLPDEVIIMIFNHLSFRDIQITRLVCKKFYEISTQNNMIKNEILVIQDEILDDNCFKLLTNTSRIFRSIKFIKIIFSSDILILFDRFGETLIDLILIECDIDNTDFNKILWTCKNLINLTLECCKALLMNLSFDYSPNNHILSKLKSLTLTRSNYLTDSILQRILKICPNIISLQLDNTEICFHSGLFKRFYSNFDEVYDKPSNLILTMRYIIEFLKRHIEKIKSLNFSHTNLNYFCLEEIATIGQLRLNELYISNCNQITRSSSIELGSWQPSIVVLDVSYCKVIDDEALENICVYMRKLKVLNIENCPVTNSGVENIVSLKSLETLNISLCRSITNDGLAKGLEKLKLQKLLTRQLNINHDNFGNLSIYLQNLLYLNLSECYNISDENLQSLFKNCFKIQYFILTECNTITDKAFFDDYLENNAQNIESKCLLNNLVRLKCLHLEACRNITDKTFCFELNDLRCLNLSKTKITSIGMNLIASKCQRIEYLNLSSCNIKDDTIIFCLTNLERLEYLCLKNCIGVTNETLSYIIKQKRLLKELEVSGCKLMTASLLNILDGCHIVNNLSRSIDIEFYSGHPTILIPPPPLS